MPSWKCPLFTTWGERKPPSISVRKYFLRAAIFDPLTAFPMQACFAANCVCRRSQQQQKTKMVAPKSRNHDGSFFTTESDGANAALRFFHSAPAVFFVVSASSKFALWREKPVGGTVKQFCPGRKMSKRTQNFHQIPRPRRGFFPRVAYLVKTLSWGAVTSSFLCVRGKPRRLVLIQLHRRRVHKTRRPLVAGGGKARNAAQTPRLM